MKPSLSNGIVGLTYSTPCPNKMELSSGGLKSQADFDHVFGHELGHVISFCNDRATIKFNEQRNALAQEGWVTNYWENCPSQPAPEEDYAESVTFYLNPTDQAIPLCATSKPKQNPFFELQPAKILHFNNFVIPVLK